MAQPPPEITDCVELVENWRTSTVPREIRDCIELVENWRARGRQRDEEGESRRPKRPRPNPPRYRRPQRRPRRPQRRPRPDPLLFDFPFPCDRLRQTINNAIQYRLVMQQEIERHNAEIDRLVALYRQLCEGRREEENIDIEEIP